MAWQSLSPVFSRPCGRGFSSAGWSEAPGERLPDVLQLGLDAIAGGEGVGPQPGRELLGQIGVVRRVDAPDVVGFPRRAQFGEGEGLHRLQHAHTGLAIRPVGHAEQRRLSQLRDPVERVGAACSHRSDGSEVAPACERAERLYMAWSSGISRL